MNKVVQYLKRLYIRIKYHRYGWRGNYSSWAVAAAAAGGYNASNILEKIKTATLKVKNGEAVYERDGLLSDKIEYSWPLLANLLWVAGKHNNQLSVIDFGGSLGTSYFQNRLYLAGMEKLCWSVVEQPAFVQAGREAIADGQLDFFDSIEAAQAAKGPHQVLLLSTMLPYMEKPYELLASLAAKNIPYLILENTYFNPQPGNRLTMQKVPPVYYEASYPAWFLSYKEVTGTLLEKYDMVATYSNDQFLYLEGEKIMYQGFIMQLKPPS